MRAAFCIAMCVSLCLAALVAAVEITIHNQSGVILTAQPARGRIPFARGELRERRMRLVDDHGTSLPCRTRPLAHWYDGSIKWLLVDSQVSLKLDEEAKFELQPGEPAAGMPRVIVKESPSGVVVKTGAARFVFSRTAFGCPSAVWLDLDGDGDCEARVAGDGSDLACDIQHEAPGAPNEENWLRDPSAGPRERYSATAAGDYAVTVEHADDLHVVVRLSGWRSSLCRSAGGPVAAASVATR